MARVTTLIYNLSEIPQGTPQTVCNGVVEHFAVRPVYVDRARRTTELTTESSQVGGKHA